MKKIFFTLAVMIFALAHLRAQTTTQVQPKGIYKEIDVDRHNKAIEILKGDNKALKQRTVDSILKNPNYYNPPVIYALSKELFSQDKKGKATYWFYVAQLRARYDANLCLDNTAKQGVSTLNSYYGPDINKYAFQNIDSLEKAVNRVIDFVKSNDENYDHRWLSLHGMDAFGDGKEKDLSKPKDQWSDIKKKTIDDYQKGFVEFLETQKK